MTKTRRYIFRKKIFPLWTLDMSRVPRIRRVPSPVADESSAAEQSVTEDGSDQSSVVVVENTSSNPVVTSTEEPLNLDLPASSLAAVQAVDWHSMGETYYAFPVRDPGNPVPRSVMEFSLTGKVRSIFLHANARAHTIIVEPDGDDIGIIGAMVSRIPNLVSNDFWWPVIGEALKFVAKETDLTKEFESVWVTTSDDLEDMSSRSRIAPSVIDKGNRVFIEYSIQPYRGRAARGTEPGFGPGCSLVLLSVGMLERERLELNFESLSKRRRLGGG
jgi:hypothetical protein